MTSTAPPTTISPPIRVLLVDDHDFVRAALSELLSAEGIDVVGECADGSEAPGAAAAVQPDVVLMDVHMPTNGLDATRALLAARPSTRVLMLTGSATGHDLSDAADAGAVGFVFKGTDVDGLMDAIRSAAAGGTAWPEPHGRPWHN